MAISVCAKLEFGNDVKISGLPNATEPQDPVTLSQLTDALQSLVWQAVQLATLSDINLTSPGAVIDGVSLAPGNQVVLMSQSTPAENGLYTWYGAEVTMTALNAEVRYTAEEGFRYRLH